MLDDSHSSSLASVHSAGRVSHAMMSHNSRVQTLLLHSDTLSCNTRYQNTATQFRELIKVRM